MVASWCPRRHVVRIRTDYGCRDRTGGIPAGRGSGYRGGQAFLTGRKGAPAGLRETQSSVGSYPSSSRRISSASTSPGSTPACR